MATNTLNTGSRSRWSRWRLWLLPCLALLALCLPHTASPGQWGVDTGLYASIAVRAVEEGHWWSLRMGEEPYFNKPPLGYWLLGAFLAALGHDLWVIRLEALATAAACVLATLAVVRRLSGPRVALLAGLVLVTTVEFFRLTDRPRLDYLCAALMLAGVWCVVAGAQRDRAWPIVLAGVPIGLALLVKPLIALLVVPIMAAWLAWTGRARLAWALAPAGALALLIAAPWHVSMALAHGEAFTGAYFGRETIHRAVGEAYQPEPWWWYGNYLVRNYWPWLPALAGACAWSIGRVRAQRLDEAGRFIALWAFAWLLGVTLVADKHKHYLIPVYPALSWLAALWIAATWPRPARRATGRALDVVVAAGLFVSVAVTALVRPQVRQPMNPDWWPLFEHLRSRGDETIWNAGLSDTDAGMLHVMTGLTPRLAREPDGDPRLPPPGSLAIFNHEFRPPPPGSVELFRSGKFAVVRTPPERAR